MNRNTKIITGCLLIILLVCFSLFIVSMKEDIREDNTIRDILSLDRSSIQEDAYFQPHGQAESLEKEITVTVLDDIWPPLSQPMLGDLDAMLKKRQIRILTTFSLGSYFIDHGHQRGVVYELSEFLEKFVKKTLGKIATKLNVIIIPVRRDQLLPYLVNGYGDVIMANLTITPNRREIVDFSNALLDKVQELLATGPASPDVKSIDDLAGKEVSIREDSSFFETLQELNQKFKSEGKQEIKITFVDPRMEREDILEMVNAGLLPMTVHDDHVLKFWSQIFEDLTIHEEMPLKEKSKIAFALRKNSPEFKAVLDKFTDEHRSGTLIGNVILNRYSDNTNWAHSALEREPFRKLDELVLLFKKFGEQYNFDWLLLASFAFQESRFDQNAKSRAGALGIMQVLPTTAADKLVGIPDISTAENNIHAGTKYLSVLRDKYFDDEALEEFDRYLFTMAGYNAGPNRINRIRKETQKRGLDPNKWFGNVEDVVASKVGREPVVYVSNIFKYYVAYRRSLNELEARNQAKRQTNLWVPIIRVR